jgi:hypothetical protein
MERVIDVHVKAMFSGGIQKSPEKLYNNFVARIGAKPVGQHPNRDTVSKIDGIGR